MPETPEERNERIATAIGKLVVDILSVKPEAEIITGKYKTEIAHYTVSVVGSEVQVERHKRSLYVKDDFRNIVKNYYLTKAEATAAIMEVLPEAQAKFKVCAEAISKLESELGFIKSYNYDGDTHGIYNEYESISFELKGFRFQFRLEN